METYAKQSKSSARTLSARAGHGQPDMATILQAYRNRTAQLAALTDDDDQALQGKFTMQLQEDDDEALQGKFVAQLQSDDDEEPLQGKFLTQLQSAEEEEPLQQKAENRTGLPDRLKNGVENLSGYSLDAVKVHYNSPKPAQLQALAYTQGTDIHVGPGQERYLGHEAWHVVQQMQGRVQPTTQLQGVALNDNEGLEREADVMGEKVLNGNIAAIPDSVSQFKVKFETNTEKYDPNKNPRAGFSNVYKSKLKDLEELPHDEVKVKENDIHSYGVYHPATKEIEIKKLNVSPADSKYSQVFDSRIGTLAHEMQHAKDRLGVSIISEKMHREWRAWAVQAAVAYENMRASLSLEKRDQEMLDCFLKHDFNTEGNAFFRKTKLYLGRGNVMTKIYISFHRAWIDEAVNLFNNECR